MSAEAETPKPRLTGEAAWKAALNAVEHRNEAAKRAAREHNSPTERAHAQRERRLAEVEREQIKALNEKLAARDEARKKASP